jgi:hypothetical protein
MPVNYAPNAVTVSSRRALLVLAAGLLLGAGVGAAPATPAVSRDDTANCIAVMQTRADDLVRKIKAGDKTQEPVLKSQLVRAGALIGRTYLDGLHDGTEAKARLKAAHERLAAWDEARKSAVHGACLQRADAELAGASAPERFFVERFAQARYKRMLQAQ